MSSQVTVAKLPPCDFDSTHSPARYDFRVQGRTSWANGCTPCYFKYGTGHLGTGIGQRLVTPDEEGASTGGSPEVRS